MFHQSALFCVLRSDLQEAAVKKDGTSQYWARGEHTEISCFKVRDFSRNGFAGRSGNSGPVAFCSLHSCNHLGSGSAIQRVVPAYSASGSLLMITAGTLTSALCGYIAFVSFPGIIGRNRLQWFGYYCLLLFGGGLL